MAETRVRGGAAVTALGIILLITAGWWALALWPVGAQAPDWVLRTRAACFGRTPSGLPNAGGWILLIGEPLGMIGVLATVWRGALWRDLQEMKRTLSGRTAMVVMLVGLLYGAHLAGVRVKTALAAPAARLASFASADDSGLQAYPGLPAPPALVLTDQKGSRFTLDRLKGRPIVVTFAFAHCEDICPTIVHDLMAARRDADAADAALVVVTLDPWRDLPSRLPTIAEQWQLGENDYLLSGSIDEVTQVLKDWEVGFSRNPQTGDIGHVAVVVLLDREGRMTHRIGGDWRRAAPLLQAL